MADSSQLTQSGSKVRWPCQSTLVGGACAELHNSDKNLRTAWFEKGELFIIIGWCVHTPPKTFLFKQLVKWILYPMTPLRKSTSNLFYTTYSQYSQVYLVFSWFYKIYFFQCSIDRFKFRCFENRFNWIKNQLHKLDVTDILNGVAVAIY